MLIDHADMCVYHFMQTGWSFPESNLSFLCVEWDVCVMLPHLSLYSHYATFVNFSVTYAFHSLVFVYDVNDHD